MMEKSEEKEALLKEEKEEEDLAKTSSTNLENAAFFKSSKDSEDSRRKVQLDGELVYDTQKHLVVLTNTLFTWTRLTSRKEPTFYLPLEDVIGVEQHSHQTLKKCFVVYCFPLLKSGKRERKVYPFICKNVEECEKWVGAFRCILRGVPIDEPTPPFRLLVCINPFGGKGLAKTIWEKVKIMFEIANIEVNVIETTHANHALEIAQSFDVSSYEGIVTVSGDGLLYEVLNGLLIRNDWYRAIKIPLGVIPGGSGNGLAASLGVTDPYTAAFTIIKGKTSPLDICSVIQDKTRVFSFLFTSHGIIADLDKDSEKYRWMGGFRFTFTAVDKVLNLRTYPMKISYIPELNAEKQSCGSNCDLCSKKTAKLEVHMSSERISLRHVEENSLSESPLGPPLTIFNNEEEHKSKFVTIEGKFSLFAVGNVPNVSYDAELFPFAHFSDGLMDLIYSSHTSKTQIAQILLSLESGSHISIKGLEYHKVKAVKFQPLEEKGYIMIDGELAKMMETKVECHRALVKVFFDPINRKK